MEKDIKKLLYKLINRFSIDIDQHNHFMYEFTLRDYSSPIDIDFYNKYREDFLSIIVEVEPYISKGSLEKLKKICLVLEACESIPQKSLSLDELESLGEEARKLALETMSELQKEF